MKKRLFTLLMAVLMVFSLTACGGGTEDKESDKEREEIEEVEETEETEEETITEVNGDIYEKVLAGGLNQMQLEFILAHSPAELEEGAYSMDDLSRLMLYISDVLYSGDSPEISVSAWHDDSSSFLHYNLADVNDMIKIVTDFQFSEENNGTCSAASASGDVLTFCPATPSKSYTAEIQSAIIKDDVMTVVYKVHIVTFEDGEWDEIRTAVLRKNADGLYQIKTITTNEMK